MTWAALSIPSTGETAEGGWRTTVEVDREGDAWMPVTLKVGPEEVRIDTRERSTTVEVVTENRPDAVELDPERVLLDVDRSDNRRELSGG